MLDDDVFRIQCDLRAGKACSTCGQPRPVVDFGRYGEPRCQTCRVAQTEADLEGWWDRQRARVGVAV